MLAVNIKFCIANFSTGKAFKIHFFIKKVVFFFIFFFFFYIYIYIYIKVDGPEIVGLKIFRSNSQANMIFITYTLLKCLPYKTMQLILYDDGHLLAVSKYGRYHSFSLSR